MPVTDDDDPDRFVITLLTAGEGWWPADKQLAQAAVAEPWCELESFGPSAASRPAGGRRPAGSDPPADECGQRTPSPLPAARRKRACGTRTSVNTMSAVTCPRCHILRFGAPIRTPGEDRSTSNIVARLLPAPACARTETRLVTMLLVIHRFRSLITKPSGVSSATVCIRSAVRSDLVSGSMVAKEDAVRPLNNSGTNRARRVSLACPWLGRQPSPTRCGVSRTRRAQLGRDSTPSDALEPGSRWSTAPRRFRATR